MALNQQDLNAVSASLLEQVNLQNKISSDFNAYLAAVKKLGELQQNINHLQANIPDLIQKAKDADKKKADADLAHQAAITSGIQTEIDLKKELFDIAEAEAKMAGKAVKYNQNQLLALNQQSKTLTGIVKKANLANLAYVETGKVWNKLPRLASEFYREIKSLAAVQMSKDIKQAELSMGILGNQSQYFSKGISKASESTIQLGFGITDIARSQAAYSEEIGRSSMMTESGIIAMAEMAKGTTLGVEGAAIMAADMERFGVSVEGSRDMIQETVDIAAKMGVNSTKAIKELTKNLKVAQTFHFKGGIRGMVEMASYAAKMKVDLNGLTGMADKVFRPEGAVEMSARLQTMGGAFAQLGNPFELMFKARNDFGAFTKDIANATSELAQFNESSGNFEISGLQLDRLREIATITGIGADQLSDMAIAGAKFNSIKSLIPGTFNPEDQELISSLAEMKDGKYKINISGKELNLNELTQPLLDAFKGEKETLADRAKQAQTFDDAFTNLVNQFKSTLLPFVEALNIALVIPIANLQEILKDENVLANIKSVAETVGTIVGAIGKFIVENPVAALVTALGGTLLFNAAKWFAQGVSLGLGFNTVARAGGGGGGGGGFGTRNMAAMDKLGMSTMGKFGANFKGVAGSSAAKLGGVAAGGFAMYDEYNEQREKGKGFGTSLARGGLKGAGAGLGAWGGAAAGGAIGAFGGPLAPITVPLGMLIGGGIGAYAGGKATDLDTYGVDDAVVKFNPQDKVVSMSDGMVASTSKGKIDDLVGGGGTMKSQKIEFGKLEISGTIKLEMPGNLVSSIDLANEPEFIRKLSTLISQQTRINLSGGKLSPNPY
jgi:hypothetical protein